jgi:hypothetical protein
VNRSLVLHFRDDRLATRSVALLACLFASATLPVGCTRKPSSVQQGGTPAAVVGQGVEVTFWTLSDQPTDIATGAAGQRLPGATPPSTLESALASLAARNATGKPQAPQPSLDAWEGSGLRITRLRAVDVAALEQAVGASAGQRKSWVAFGAHPTELVRGSRGDDRTMLSTDVGPLALSSGSIKLSLRSWPLYVLPPSYAQSGAAQVELLLSVVGKPRSTRGSILASNAAENLPSLKGILNSDETSDPKATPGRAVVPGLLPRLTLSALVSQGDCLLIESISSTRVSDEGKGPPVPGLPSVGEALLSDIFAFPRAGVRTVAIIRPMIEARSIKDE